ncbi:hypothetical protein ATANTOWER_002482 [Ataeniobius toweri]|uniref:Uncharacterized protein n=1 Tax=Ataeniobius toweri TaxID=208326 RepID=A0ABU7BZF8_9TELE|nr:hypothetical protein [Ataeniobius toweri]
MRYCLSVITKGAQQLKTITLGRCITSGSDGIDQRLGVNQFELIPGLNLWADSSVSLQLSKSCPPSQHLLFGPFRPPRLVKLTTLSHTPGFLTVLPGGFTRDYLCHWPEEVEAGQSPPTQPPCPWLRASPWRISQRPISKPLNLQI